MRYFLLPISVLISFSTIAQDLFTQFEISSIKESQFQQVFWFDNNNDGLNDLIFYKDNSILISQGDSSFRALPIVIPEKLGYSWILTDMDKNGLVDILNYENDEIKCLYNYGSHFSNNFLTAKADNYNGANQWLDIDGDGDLDFLYSTGYKSAEQYSNKLVGYLNDHGEFKRFITFGYEINYHIFDPLISTDVDNDGDVDLLICDGNDDDKFLVYKQESLNSFKLDSIYFSGAGYGLNIYPADFNNDGFIDFYLNNNRDNKIYKNLNGVFHVVESSIETGKHTVADWGDFDNDGLMDLLLTTHRDPITYVIVLKNGGDETFEKVDQILEISENTTAKWVNINNDGFLDISISHRKCLYWEDWCTQPYLIEFFLNNKNGISNKKPPTPVNLKFDETRNIISWECEDIDETPIENMQFNMLINRGSEKVVFPFAYPQTGNLMFHQHGNAGYTAFYLAEDLEPGDYTAAVQSIDGGQASSSFSPQISFTIYAGPSDLSAKMNSSKEVGLSWINSVSYDSIVIERMIGNLEFQRIATIKDNQDEYIDYNLPFINDNIQYRIYGYIQNAKSSYSYSNSVLPLLFVPEDVLEENSPFRYEDRSWGDYDNDGDFDAVCAANSSLFIFKNKGNEEFEKITLESIFDYHSFVQWLDYDNDNLLDVIAESYQDGVLILKNYGNDMFKYQNVDNPYKPGALFADIDVDGEREVLYWDSEQFFLQKVDIEEPLLLFEIDRWDEIPRGITAKDFTNDKEMDILMLGLNGAFLKKIGDLEFETKDLPDTIVNKRLYNYRNNLQMGDLNNDGLLDLGFTSYKQQSFEYNMGFIYSGDGNMEVGILDSIIPANNPLFYIADFNNDGLSDITFRRYIYNRKEKPAVFLQTDSIFTFLNLTENYSISYSYDVVDIDGDSDLDVISYGTNSETEEWLGVLFRNYSADYYSQPNSPSSAPGGINVKFEGNRVVVTWESSTDDLTPAHSLFYNYYLMRNDSMVISPSSDLLSGRRLVLGHGNNDFNRSISFSDLKAGDYSFAVQSIDNGYLGSPFSQKAFFTISASPELTDIVQLNSEEIRLTWNPVDNAENIIIKRSNSPYGPFQIIAEIDGQQSSFDDVIGRNTLAYYQIQATGNQMISGILEFSNKTSDFIEKENINVSARSIVDSSVGDIDVDGDLDLFILTEDSISIYKNSNGDFTRHKTLPTHKTANSMLLTDFNDDNIVDIVLELYLTPQSAVLAWLKGQDVGEFADPIYVEGGEFDQLLAADFDQDGKKEVYYNGQLMTYSDNSIDVKTISYSYLDAGTDYGVVGALDINSDQHTDIVYGGSADNEMIYFQALKTSLSFDRESFCYKCATQISSLNDFNNDGLWDMINISTSNYPGIHSYISYNPGQTTQFVQESLGFMAFEFGSIATADYDNDGFADAVFSGKGKYQTKEKEFDNALINDGAGTVLPAEIALLSDTLCRLDFADIDRDQDLDIIVTNLNNEELGIKIFTNTTHNVKRGLENQRPPVPTDLQQNRDMNNVELSWSLPDTDETSREAITYNLQVRKESGEVLMSSLSTDNDQIIPNRYGNTSNLTSWELHGLEDGIYYWKVQAIDATHNVSSFSEEKRLRINTQITGIQDANNNSLLYPNPAKDEIFLTKIVESSSITLCDMLGRMSRIDDKFIEYNPTKDQYRIGINGLQDGVYYLIVESNLKKTVHKFVKK